MSASAHVDTFARDNLPPPEVIAQEREKGKIIGYKLSDWTDAGGLKFPGKLSNVALADEVWVFSNVKVGEPDDNTYMRNVNE